jgi:hypothetical protein
MRGRSRIPGGDGRRGRRIARGRRYREAGAIDRSAKSLPLRRSRSPLNAASKNSISGDLSPYGSWWLRHMAILMLRSKAPSMAAVGARSCASSAPRFWDGCEHSGERFGLVSCADVRDGVGACSGRRAQRSLRAPGRVRVVLRKAERSPVPARGNVPSAGTRNL